MKMYTVGWTLAGGLLQSDEKVTFQGRPARLLVIRPALFQPKDGKAPARGEETGPTPCAIEAKVWLDESGVPLAMERGFEL